MVGLVIVSHSPRLGEGVVELAREMAGPEVSIGSAAGLDLPGRPMGTDAMLVLRAIEAADSGDGVLVLVDLGSAVLSAEAAIEILDDQKRSRVLLCEAPLVEGAVAAAAAARAGLDLAAVAAEARAGLAPKASQISGSPGEGGGSAGPGPLADAGAVVSAVLVAPRPLGLHARPAARLLRALAGCDARTRITNKSTGRGPAPANSLNALLALGAAAGEELVVEAWGPQAREAVDAAVTLSAGNFGDEPAPSEPPEGRPGEFGPPVAAPVHTEAEVFVGSPASSGVAVGPARYLRPPPLAAPLAPQGDPGAELLRLKEALARVGREIMEARDAVVAKAGPYAASIFEAQILLIEDEVLVARASGLVGTGIGAAGAWVKAVEETAGAFAGLEDEYLSQRAGDLQLLAQRVLGFLTGRAPSIQPEGAGIVIAGDLSPAETVALRGDLVLGIVTAYGGSKSHAAIVARAMGIPSVAGAGEPVLHIGEGVPLLIDGGSGRIYRQPDAAVVAELTAREAARVEQRRLLRASARGPALTSDGVRIEVAANVASLDDVIRAVEEHADGVGLARTEFLFMNRDSPPGEDEQYALYARMAEILGGRPLVLRMLDIGGDKPVPYLSLPPERNPFLGMRGVRLALSRPELVEGQVRAALRVAGTHPVGMMLPMVATLGEVREVRAMVAGFAERLRAEGAPVPGPLRFGIMVEVPSAALIADRLAAEVDFFSIGTNDLTQYTLAADRSIDSAALPADSLDPAVLALIARVAAAAESGGIEAAVCGELAWDEAAVPILVGLGVSSLSVPPFDVGRVKQRVRQIDSRRARRLAQSALRARSAGEVREMSLRFAEGANPTTPAP